VIMVVGFRVLEPGALALPTAPIPTAGSGITNTEAIGRVLYTKYAYYFEGAGLILLVAMIGAIVLTLRHKEGVKRQSIAAQVARGKTTAIDVVNLPPGGAIVPAGTQRRGWSDGANWALSLSDGRRDPGYTRHLLRLSQPPEHHSHPDVDCCNDARRQHQSGRLLLVHGRPRRAGVRALCADGGGRRGRHWSGDRRRLLPQPRFHRGRGHQHDEGLR